MKTLASGSLPIGDIRDEVNVDGGIARLTFDYAGREIRIDCKVDHDWVDAGVFGRFVDLLAEADPSKIYLYHDLKGQDCVIACVTRPQFEELKRSGVAFQPLR